MRRNRNMRKLAGLLLLLLPIGILALFTVGELAGGDVSGVQHVAQTLPIVVLALVAWKKPRTGGIALVVIGAGLAVLYAFLAPAGIPLSARVGFGALLFTPAILSGALFMTSQNE